MMQLLRRPAIFALLLGGILLTASCGPPDNTEKAGEIVREANKDLKQIKSIYEKNEDKREDLKKALTSDDVAAVRSITDDLVKAIGDGTKLGLSAKEKLDEARDMQDINADYKHYLMLKSEALDLQLRAFNEYKIAAGVLHDSYDPNDKEKREQVSAKFKTASDSFQRLMEEARDYSTEAKDFAKDVQQKEEGK